MPYKTHIAINIPYNEPTKQRATLLRQKNKTKYNYHNIFVCHPSFFTKILTHIVHTLHYNRLVKKYKYQRHQASMSDDKSMLMTN